MDANLKKKWVDALRSGEYEQGGDCLRFDDGSGKPKYCCLGVLADVIDPQGWDQGSGERRHQLGQRSNPEAFLSNWIISPALQKELSRMNDAGCSFDEIADYIETTIRSS